jgi:hypothetical protein
MRQRVLVHRLIVRFIIIINTQNHHIYTQTKRRGNRLDAGETERERESMC